MTVVIGAFCVRGEWADLYAGFCSGVLRPFDGHLSRRHVAVPLQRSTRGLGEPRHHPLS